MVFLRAGACWVAIRGTTVAGMDGVCIVNGRAGVDVAETIEAVVVGAEVAGGFGTVVAVTIDEYVAGTMSAEVAGAIDAEVAEMLNV